MKIKILSVLLLLGIMTGIVADANAHGRKRGWHKKGYYGAHRHHGHYYRPHYYAPAPVYYAPPPPPRAGITVRIPAPPMPPLPPRPPRPRF